MLVTSSPRHGQVTVDPLDGSIAYTAADGFTGSDTFRYTVRDSAGRLSKPATVTIQVNRPTAADDGTDTDAGNAVAIDVLANDTDPDGNAHIHQPGSVAIVPNPLHGMVSVNSATNEVTYTPAAGFAGTDSFRYSVTDDAGATSSPAQVFVRVNRPTAADDFAAFSGTTPVAIDVLGNDADPDGHEKIEQPGSVAIVSAPLHGRATVDPVSNVVTYTANVGFNGTDSFRYTVTDEAGPASPPARVTVVGTRVTGVSDDSIDTDGTNPVAIDVLVNDHPSSSGGRLDPSTLAIASAPRHGRISVDLTTGQITYVAHANFGGTDSFRYRITSVPGGTLFGTLTVVVNRPTAADDGTDTDAGNPVSIDVLANDTDPDGNDHIHQPGRLKSLHFTRIASARSIIQSVTDMQTLTDAPSKLRE